MTKRKSDFTLPTNSLDELFSSQEERDDAKLERVKDIPLTELHPFKDHLFKIQNDDEMKHLVESIQKFGTLTPALARPLPEGGYELISGHRRLAACPVLGVETMPVIVREMTDDEAVIAMVDANLQREHILPSEKAFSYKMKLDAIKHQGKASVQVAEKLLSVEKVADDAGESKDQVRRYIRLTYLIPELLEMVDENKIAFNPAVEISYLEQSEQRVLLNAIELNDCTPSHAQSIRLKKLSQEGDTARPDDLRHPRRAKAQPAGAVQIQAGGHSQIFPEELYGQAGLRYGHQAVGTMAVPTGTGQRQPLIRTENVCGVRPLHNGKNCTGRVQWPCRCRTVRECQIQRTEVKQIWYQDIYRLKKGYYYAVLSYYDSKNKRHVKYISTGFPEKGNKRKAEAELVKIRNAFEPPAEIGELCSNMLCADYLLGWLEIVKVRVKPTTFGSYESMVNQTIEPYFRNKPITLKDLEARHIQQFYSEKLRTVKPNFVIHYHAVIHQALKYAMKTDLVAQNVAMKVDRPKKNDFQPVFLDAAELQHLFEVVKGTKLELPVLVAAFYGLRRGEVLGLKWDAIDFERGTLTIKRTVTSVNVGGKTQVIEQKSAKTKSSMRALPLVGRFKEYFAEVKAAQELNKQVCGNCYNYEYDGFVFVDELGERIKPDYLISQFPAFIQQHGMKKMRFHDLRHSCASLLLANGVPLKQIQNWLRHSDFSTTANIYAHLDYSSKLSSAQAMVSRMPLPEAGDFGSRWEQNAEKSGA